MAVSSIGINAWQIFAHSLFIEQIEELSIQVERRYRQTRQFISYPCLIIEVFSPTTEAYDRGKKFKLHQRSTSLVDYVLVDAEEIATDVFHKNDRHKWEVTNYVAGDNVELESINLTFPTERIYRGIEF